MTTTFTDGQAVEILAEGEWVGPFTVTAHTGRTADHLVLSGPSGLFEHYNDAPYNTRPVAEPEPEPVPANPVRSQEYCPRCHRMIALHDDGTFYAHGPLDHRCPGSGQEAELLVGAYAAVAEAPVAKMNKAEIRRWLTRARQDIRDIEAALKANDADAVQEWAEDLSGVGATISTLIDAAK